MLVVGGALLGSALAQPGVGAQDAKIRKGGTLRYGTASGISTIDPAVVQPGPGVCAPLMNYRDKPLPEAFRLQPDAAAGLPGVSRDGKVYTFIVESDFRFSNGARLTARNFVAGLNRLLDPRMGSETAGIFQNIVGAQAVMEGKTRTTAGVSARGRRLVFRLKSRDPVFPARLAGLCPVPRNLPVDPEGIRAPFSGAGPYFVASWTRGRGMVLKRNRFYGGDRPHHLNSIAYVVVPDAAERVRRIEQGSLDAGDIPPTERDELARRYGINGPRFFLRPGEFTFYLAFNTQRQLFRNNARLRRAVNYALDRRRLVAPFGPFAFRPEDRYVPPLFPGIRKRLYPLRPNLRKARALARRQTRGGKAVFYTRTGTAFTAHAQVVKQNLRAIGIDVEVRQFPFGLLFEKLAAPAEPFDIANASWGGAFPDPWTFVNERLESGQIQAGNNAARFRSRRYARLMARAARLQGRARYRAYGKLEYELRAKAAPWAVWGTSTTSTFVSRRVGCIVIRYSLDLAAACLKR